MLEAERLQPRARFAGPTPDRGPLLWLAAMGRKLATLLSPVIRCPRCQSDMELAEDRVTHWDSYVVCGTQVYNCPVCSEQRELAKVFSITE